MGKPKAPKAPDYAAAAREQGVANTNSAIATNFLNQQNQVGPYGSQTYSYSTPGNGGHYLPDGTYIPETTVTTSLSAGEQQLYDQNNQISTQMNDLALKGLGYADKSMINPIDRNKLPGLTGSVNPQNFQTSYDFSQVGGMPTKEEFAGQRDKITDAMMQRLQPYLDKERQALDSRLANQGIGAGSEAYNWDQDVFNRGANDQRIAALLAGDTEAQRLFDNAMGVRQQGVNEAMAQGNFGAQAREAQFGQGLAAAQFGNQARGQALQEEDYFKNQPINMINALRTGNQVTAPQFGNVAGGASIAAAPVYQSAQDQYTAALEKYKQKMGNLNAVMGAVGGLGSAAVGKWG